MSGKTAIEWTETVWNPVRGCTRVSEGCRHCYAERHALRFSGPGQPYEGLVHKVGGEPRRGLDDLGDLAERSDNLLEIDRIECRDPLAHPVEQ